MSDSSLILRRSLFTKLPLTALLAGLGAGCSGQMGGLSPADQTFSAPVGGVQSQPLEGSNTIGSGPVRVALVVPLTQASGPSLIGTSMRNAAEMAIAEANSSDLTLLVKDDRSTPEGARDAAKAALAEGAELFIGPLFANNVREVGAQAKAAGRPVIGFSTDSSVAQPGVYLLSFLIETQVDRVVEFAAAKGKKSFAALVPDGEYGNVALAEFQQVAARKNLRVMSIERYSPGQAASAVAKINALGNQIDTVFVPEQADNMPNVAPTLAGLAARKIQILGTGVWNDARVLSLQALQGAWFAAPENAGFNAFAARYRAKYGSEPTRVASLAYDSVSLAAALARTQGAQRFVDRTLTNSSGFNGADGVFRFRTDGLNERGIAVYQVGAGAATTLSAAPKTFAAGT
eukprot:gene2526-2565_t